MLNSFSAGLAAIVLGVGITGASAATVDLSQQAKSTIAPSSLVAPQGEWHSGFAAIRTQNDNGLKSDSFVELPASVTALGALVPGQAVPLQGIGAEQALMAPEGMHENPNAFSAIRAASGSSGESNRDQQTLRSDAAARAPSSLLSPPSK